MKKTFVACLLLLMASELRAASLPRTILVLPFENKSARADVSWISESFAETLTTRLSGSGRHVLGRNERDTAFDQLGIPAGTPVTLASTYKIAETLRADWVVTGEFTLQGDALKTRVRVLDVAKLRLTLPMEENGGLADLIDLQTRLAWRILATQDPEFMVGPEEEFQRLFPRVRLDAFENYVRGIIATDAESRVRFLSEADRLDPSDHRPALELGRFYYDEKDCENSARWLRRIEARDANYSEALFMSGVNEFFLGNEAAAEEAFRALSQQMPINEVWNNLGFVQARRGRLQEATASLERAYQGDPTDPDYSFNLGACFWYGRSYQKAVQYLQEAVQLAPDDPETHRLLAAALVGAVGDSAGRQRESRWLAAQEGVLANELNAKVLPDLRLKINYTGRAVLGLEPANKETLEPMNQLRSGSPTGGAKP